MRGPMGQELKKWKRRKTALEQIDEIKSTCDHVLIIHYSCESFYEIKDSRTPRVTSIAVKNFSTGQTSSFSIHKSAEQMGASLEEIDARYREFEKNMLDEYFDFIKSRHGYTFVHWNMRNINYGFKAIEHRYKVLDGNPLIIDDTRKFDLARALSTIYGDNYIGHNSSGRLHSLVEHNKMTMKDMLTGREEAAAFEEKEFVKLHQSTLRKVNLMTDILERIVDRSLKTNSTWWEINVAHLYILVEIVTNHPIWALLAGIATIATIASAISAFARLF